VGYQFEPSSIDSATLPSGAPSRGYGFANKASGHDLHAQRYANTRKILGRIQTARKLGWTP
jgi:hypothetical protein